MGLLGCVCAPVLALHPPPCPPGANKGDRNSAWSSSPWEVFGWLEKPSVPQLRRGKGRGGDRIQRSGPGTAGATLPLLPLTALQRENTDGATRRAGWRLGEESFGNRKQNEPSPKWTLKTQMDFFVVSLCYWCETQPPSMTGSWKVPSPSGPVQSREIKPGQREMEIPRWKT